MGVMEHYVTIELGYSVKEQCEIYLESIGKKITDCDKIIVDLALTQFFYDNTGEHKDVVANATIRRVATNHYMHNKTW